MRFWHIARSVLSNWFATVATLAVGFFLQPFVVHHLGDLSYGIWVLTVSTIGYLVMLDLGMTNSLLRYISKGHAVQNHESSSDSLSAVLWVRLQISALILVLTAAIAIEFPRFFKVPPALGREAREAVLIIGLATAITMTFGVFGATLSALNRYDLRTYVTLAQLTIRMAGVIFVLRSGYGIVAIALCELVAACVGNVMLFYLSRAIYPELTVRLVKPKWEVLRSIWSYSSYAFLLTIAVQLVYQSDNMVVGAFISASAVTFYSIGNTLCRYTQQLVNSMTNIFCPVASTFEAAGNLSALRTLYINGTRATLVLSLPIVTTLIIRGHTFIGLWMGAEYAAQSGVVLAILATALLFSLQNLTAGSIALGVGKHKTVAWWAVGEGIANLTLSIVLVRRFGIRGVAIGTLLPSLVVQVIFWPRYVCQLTDVSFLEVYRSIWAPIFLCTLPFMIATYLVDTMSAPRNVIIFILQTSALLPIFAVAVAFTFRDSVRRQLFPRVRSFLSAHAN